MARYDVGRHEHSDQLKWSLVSRATLDVMILKTKSSSLTRQCCLSDLNEDNLTDYKMGMLHDNSEEDVICNRSFIGLFLIHHSTPVLARVISFPRSQARNTLDRSTPHGLEENSHNKSSACWNQSVSVNEMKNK